MSVERLVSNWMAAHKRWSYEPQDLTLDLIADFAEATDLGTLKRWYCDDVLTVLEYEELVALHLERTTELPEVSRVS